MRISDWSSDVCSSDLPHASRAAGARILLVEDHLLRDRQATAAGLFRPADTGPATRRKLALPLLAQVRKCLLVTGTATMPQLGKASAQVLAHPACDVVAERLAGARLGQTGRASCGEREGQDG